MGLCVGLYNTQTYSYDLPSAINLGITNILDGGPKVESPGLYIEPYVLNYHAKQFTNACGKPLNKTPVRFNSCTVFTELLYQSRFKVLGGAPGCSFILPPVQFAYASCNKDDISCVDAGFANPLISAFFQWDMIHRNNKPFFIHRLGTYVILPWGTNQFPKKTFNPADILTALDSFWACSLYFTPHFAASCRLHYLWSSTNKKTHIKPGDCFHMNYSLEYEIRRNIWIGVNGYYLQQLKNNTKHGVSIPHSKERTFSAGPGFLCQFSHGYEFLGHIYFEQKAINRPQGINTVINLIKLF